MTSIDYVTALRRARRRAILEILADSAEGSTSELLLEPVLGARRVFGSDRDAIRTDILWLGEQGFVAVDDVGGILFCTITASGAAIAAGKRVHPDIERSPYRR